MDKNENNGLKGPLESRARIVPAESVGMFGWIQIEKHAQHELWQVLRHVIDTDSYPDHTDKEVIGKLAMILKPASNADMDAIAAAYNKDNHE